MLSDHAGKVLQGLSKYTVKGTLGRSEKKKKVAIIRIKKTRTVMSNFSEYTTQH